MHSRPELLPEIDLSVVTYNSAQWLQAFFESLRAQAYPLDKIHVFMRDNGSSDATMQDLERLRAAGSDFASFSLVCGTNVGFGMGHNSNLAIARSAFFLVSNVDMVFDFHAILCVASQAVADSERVASWELRQKPYEHPKAYHPVTLETSWSSGACTLYRREALVKVGGFEPKIFMYGEDVELSYRLRAEGYILKYIPSAVCWHFSYAKPNETKPLQFVESKLGNAYIRLRYGTWFQVLQIVPMFMALFALSPRFPGQRSALLSATRRLIGNAAWFLKTRKAGRADFPIRGFDFERRRMGTFYVNEALPSSPPLVSVVMRTYKGRDAFLREAVASVLNQTWPNVELVVVEDGSSSAEGFLREVAASERLASVRYLSEPKGGRSKAGNAGLRASTGEFICFLDDDDLFFADHIEVLATMLLKKPAVGAAYGAAWQVITRMLPGALGRYQEVRYDVVHTQKFNRALLLLKNFIPIQAIVFRRSLYLTFGGFDEEIEHLEDWHLWIRYASTQDFVFIPKLTSLYRVPESSSTAISRQKSFVSGYEAVLQKTGETKLTLTLAEIREAAEFIAKQDSLFRIRRIAAKRLFVSLPFASTLYKLWTLFRKAV